VYASRRLKCHKLAAFFAAMLNSQSMGFYSPSPLVQDAKRHSTKVASIDVTISGLDSRHATSIGVDRSCSLSIVLRSCATALLVSACAIASPPSPARFVSGGSVATSRPSEPTHNPTLPQHLTEVAALSKAGYDPSPIYDDR
jgi:hypothetical protein